VPTALVYRRGAFYVGNLSTFPVSPGNSKISRRGQVEVWATGFTTILGLAFDKQGRLHVLKTGAAPGFPTPNRRRVLRVKPGGTNEIIADSLFFPTGMTFGPDGKLHVSHKGFGPPVPGFGEILRISVPGAQCPDEDEGGEGN